MLLGKNDIRTFNLKCLYYIVVLCSALFIQACNSSTPQFKQLNASETNITFTNTLKDKKLFNILYYLYYYNGGGVATGDINKDGLPDIYFTANSKGNNKLYLNKGNFQFEDITASAGVSGNSDWCSGVTMADVNSDGLTDIYVASVSGHHGLKGHNELFINKGNNEFKESAAEYGLDFAGFTTQTAFFDYDHDGDLDCYILNHSQKPNSNILDTMNRRKPDSLSGDRLYRNDLNTTTKKFTQVSAAAGIYQSSLGYGLGIAVADINNDGWEDIYIGNDFHENDYYYINNKNGTFTESGAKTFDHYSRFSMGNDIADYNNDGQLDVITVDMLPPDEKVLKTYGSDENPDIYKFKLINKGYQYQYSKNVLQRNNGNGTSFSETSLLSGVSSTDWSWSPLFADFDNDGKKDIFISSGIVKRPVDLDYVRFVSSLVMQMDIDKTDAFDDQAIAKMPDGSSHPYFFKGEANYAFTDKSDDWGTGKMKGYYNGSAYADLDNDGNLDMVMNCINAPAAILKNNGSKKNYLSVSFNGDSLNTAGVGGKVYVFNSGNLQYQQLMLTRGFQSACEARLHFGMDSLTKADSILVVWPDQSFQVLKNVPVNSQLVVEKKNASGQFVYDNFFKPATQHLYDLGNSFNLNWKHQENEFVDFNIQYLIPHAQSTHGPKLAIGDINGDGLDDFYACGAHGQAGSLFTQQQSGSFTVTDSAVFNKDAACEDVDAIFVDVNGDKALDLYVVSGGNEKFGTDPFLLDRLYYNDGKGHFSKATASLPLLYQNKSCVTAADIDHDGDTDLFVGTLANPRAFGIPQTSFLLLNNGKGVFALAPSSTLAAEEIGMVTAASFTDINADGWNDLIVTGEWMPIIVYLNKNGQFSKQAIEHSTGLWQTLLTDDVNGDGKMDILAGNWGWNNKFWSGKNGPMRLYVSDFDNNGKVDQLLSYTLNGEEYPFLAKDEVERPLPLLKKHYLLYADYAGVPMKEVFYGWIDTVKPIIAERLGSAVLYGDGKGGFTLNNLPIDLQKAPITCFTKTNEINKGHNSYIAGGNFYDVIPYEGRYDAQPLTLFTAATNNTIQAIPQYNLSAVKGQVRDLKNIKTASAGYVLMAARNNNNILFLGTQK
ncbi:MAG: VCBS repeat-containing protein [Ferruginibacter sp.]